MILNLPTRKPLLLVSCLLLSIGCKGDSNPDNKESASSTSAAHTHGDGESCFIEDPSKREAGRLWCKEHNVYEDRCWECHPELRNPDRPYCAEHGMYEDECPICHPSQEVKKGTGVKVEDNSPDTGAAHKHETGAGTVADTDQERKNGSEIFCNEHNVPEHECGICQPELASTLGIGKALSIRLPAKRSAQLAGVTVARPEPSTTTASTIALLGEIRLDGNKRARVTPLASGVLTKILVDVGQNVEAGQLMAVIHAPEVAKAKADYLSAQAESSKWKTASKRQSQLFGDRIGSRRAMEEAQASAKTAQVATRLARQHLINFGFGAKELSKLRTASSTLYLRAPFGGTVVNRSAVLGEAVDVSKTLFEIADLSQMWVELSVPTEHAATIHTGTMVEVSLRSVKGKPIEGAITWVSPITDERTRMVRARAVIPNDDRMLRHGMFADVRAVISTHDNAIRLPASAVHRIDNLPFVFLRVEEDLFSARRIELGDRLPSDEYVILAGISDNDEVVMTGGFSIKSALLAERLGAGCTDD